MSRASLAFLSAGLIFSLICGFKLAAAETTSTSTATSSVQTMTREDLQTQVQAKAQQLDEINKQIEAAKQTLSETKGSRLTLQRALTTIQSNINQLDLSIKSDQISVEELNLEIESLNYDLKDIQSSMADEKAAIGKTMVELQKDDRTSGNLLIIFLSSETLADGILETQNIKNLQSQMTANVANFRTLNDEYNNKLQNAAQKKRDIAFHQQNLINKKLIIQDQKTERQTILVQTKNKETAYAKQVADLEKLQRQIADEVETLDAVLRTKIDPSLLPAPGRGVLLTPVQGIISQGYGATQFAKNGYQGRWHNGVDIAAPIGTPIFAAEDGEVAAVGNQDSYCYRGAYGKFIVINHKNNLTTLYAHLSRQIVKKGDIVSRGQVIGYVGSTGYATGPHLHLTVYAQPTYYTGPSKTCGPMPYGGDLSPLSYL